MSNCQINGSNYGVISIISHFMLAIHWGQLNVWVDIFSVFFSFSNFLIFWPLNKHKTVLFDHLSYLWCGSCFGKCFFFLLFRLLKSINYALTSIAFNSAIWKRKKKKKQIMNDFQALNLMILVRLSTWIAIKRRMQAHKDSDNQQFNHFSTGKTHSHFDNNNEKIKQCARCSFSPRAFAQDFGRWELVKDHGNGYLF